MKCVNYQTIIGGYSFEFYSVQKMQNLNSLLLCIDKIKQLFQNKREKNINFILILLIKLSLMVL